MTHPTDLRHAPQCASLKLPDDWDDGATWADQDAGMPEELVDFEDLKAQSRAAMLSSGPASLVKAMLALDDARTDAEIAAARDILRVTGF